MGSSKVLKRLGLWGSVSSIAFMETDISPLPPPTPVSARVQFGDSFWAPQSLGTLGTTISPPRRLQKDEGLPCVEKKPKCEREAHTLPTPWAPDQAEGICPLFQRWPETGHAHRVAMPQAAEARLGLGAVTSLVSPCAVAVLSTETDEFMEM